jgi:hypothetical protein
MLVFVSTIQSCKDKCDEPDTNPVIDQSFQVKFVNQEGESIFQNSELPDPGYYSSSNVVFYNESEVELNEDNPFTFIGDELFYSYIFYTQDELNSILSEPFTYEYYIQFHPDEDLIPFNVIVKANNIECQPGPAINELEYVYKNNKYTPSESIIK